LSTIITGDRSWNYGYDLETKKQSSQWKMKGKVKRVLIIFFDIWGTADKEFLLAGQTVNSTNCCEVLQQMCENFILNFGNKRTRCCNMTMQSHTRECMTKNNMTVILYPPYFPVSLIEDTTERPPF
jgi:hypothetical protein